jgi:uncharacterized protein with HEPN domain
MTENAFCDDLKTQSAVIRQFEIIGEATKRLSQSFRDSHTDIPWKEMAGMRDVLIHAYDEINVTRVWNAATRSVPELATQIRPLMPTL